MSDHASGHHDAASEYTSYMRSPLPTRVSSACERCRRHKTRCDPFRPCSLCVRAKVSCRPLPISRGRKGSIRSSKTSRRNSQRQLTSPAMTPGAGLEDVGATATPAPLPDIQDNPSHSDVHSSHRSAEYGEAESTMGIAQKIVGLGPQPIGEEATSAIPGYQASTKVATPRAAVVGQRYPIASILGQPLPDTETMYLLLEDYFDAVHWFSLVIYEPTFRRNLRSIADGYCHPSQKPFLILLAVVLGMGAWYRSQKKPTDPLDNGNWRDLSARLLKLVESYIVDLMDQPSITAAQTFILFGSYCVYHGRPNLSFSLLGATIRISQAAGLHREPTRANYEENEERKRVWWTIYTWDRFASITYGRPLGINDRDCNISMPEDIRENPYFLEPRSTEQYTVCYSTYQRELNRLYLMASRALETIFGSRTSGSSQELTGDAYVELAKEATRNLQRWREELPTFLTLNLEQDFHPDSGLSPKAHALQSLSLHLTYDNILIVLHRPLLARQVENLSAVPISSTPKNGFNPENRHSDQASPSRGDSPFEAVSPIPPVSSSVHWWNAALRTSRVTQLPVLAQLATDSHLVAFLAINMFNAAIVLAVIALSDPLSDTAQVVKRTITRILRLQDLLGRRSALSKQSTTVLKNVIALLLRRESEAILAPITGNTHEEGHQSLSESAPLSVEDTLRLPLDATLEPCDMLPRRQAWPDSAIRLNESLASVQDVVPSGNPDQSFDCQSPSMIQHPTGQAQPWPPTGQIDWSGTGTSESFDNMTYINSERGLYWLWDMSWNGGNV